MINDWLMIGCTLWRSVAARGTKYKSSQRISEKSKHSRHCLLNKDRSMVTLMLQATSVRMRHRGRYKTRSPSVKQAAKNHCSCPSSHSMWHARGLWLARFGSVKYWKGKYGVLHNVTKKIFLFKTGTQKKQISGFQNANTAATAGSGMLQISFNDVCDSNEFWRWNLWRYPMPLSA